MTIRKLIFYFYEKYPVGEKGLNNEMEEQEQENNFVDEGKIEKTL